MSQRMVMPDGTVIDVDPSEMSIAQAHNAVPYGSPQHMAMLGVKGPDAPAPTPSATNMMTADQGTLAQQHVTGMGVKGPVSDVAGLMSLIPGLNKTQLVKNLVSYGKPATPEESSGMTDYQIASAALPVAAGAKAASAVNIGERVIQGRNAAGQFLKAVRKPVTSDLVTRAAVRAGTQGAVTGLQSAARSGNFDTGAVAGAVGGAIPEAAPVTTKLASAALARLMANPATRGLVHGVVRGAMPLGIGYEIAHGKMPDMETLVKLGLIGGAVSTRGAVPAIGAVTPGMLTGTTFDAPVQTGGPALSPDEIARRQALLSQQPQ